MTAIILAVSFLVLFGLCSAFGWWGVAIWIVLLVALNNVG